MVAGSIVLQLVPERRFLFPIRVLLVRRLVGGPGPGLGGDPGWAARLVDGQIERDLVVLVGGLVVMAVVRGHCVELVPSLGRSGEQGREEEK